MTKSKKLLAIGATLSLIAGSFLSSCYYDSMEELGYLGAVCDTTTVTYSGDIAPLLDGSCLTCHSAVNADALGGGNNMEGYDNLINFVTAGDPSGSSFYNSIAWVSGTSFMPKGESQLPECDINTVKAWIDQGALNN
jgi:hypothetical protein